MNLEPFIPNFGKKLKKKSHSAVKNLKGGPFGIVRYCMLRGKLFWFSSLGQQAQFGVFSKICRTFGRTILVTSGGLKKTLTKSHDYTRLFSGKALTKNFCPGQVFQRSLSTKKQNLFYTSGQFSSSGNIKKLETPINAKGDNMVEFQKMV